MTANNKEDTHRRRVAPAYLKRKGSIGKDGKRAPDRAITYLWVDGDRRQVHLGTWKSPQSRERFARVMSLYVQGEEQAALEAAKPERSPTDDTVTVEELVGQFLRHAEGYYRKPDLGEHPKAASREHLKSGQS